MKPCGIVFETRDDVCHHISGYEAAPFIVRGKCQLCEENPGTIFKVHYERRDSKVSHNWAHLRLCNACLNGDIMRFITSPSKILRDFGEYKKRSEAK